MIVMKGRPKSIRTISFIPAVAGFNPFGGQTKPLDGNPVVMTYEEYEALRLNDYEKLIQCEAAEVMGVSRPTYTRIYMSARQKIAKAFVEGRRIDIRGGSVQLESGWYFCKNCKSIFSVSGGNEVVCGLCGSHDVEPYVLPDTDFHLYPKRKKCCCKRDNEKK